MRISDWSSDVCSSDLELLRSQPDLARSTAVEELLRFCSPVACGAVRRLTAAVELHGVTLPRGSTLLGMLTSANRDESPLPEPDLLDLTRDPTPHLAFAFGAHLRICQRLASGRAAGRERVCKAV